ncbi:MAG: hypothetical protein Q7K42_01420, partial [Candidatus Diapherotrites archaeon]|nr:hypothetical protein [Candidatus Diapherotrites archaeon]
MPKPGHRIKRMNLVLRFGIHSGVVPVEKIKQDIVEKRPHIYVPEYAPFDVDPERHEKLFEKGKIFQGENLPMREFAEAEAKAVAEHGLPVRIIPPPEGYVRLRDEDVKHFMGSIKSFSVGRLNQAIDLLAKDIRIRAKLDSMFDAKRLEVLKNFRQTILPKVLKRNPELADAEELNVLMHLGLGHRKLYHDLKGIDGLNVRKVFSKGLYTFNSRDELVERIRFKNFQLDL